MDKCCQGDGREPLSKDVLALDLHKRLVLQPCDHPSCVWPGNNLKCFILIFPIFPLSATPGPDAGAVCLQLQSS